MEAFPLRLFVGLRVGPGPRTAMARVALRLCDQDASLRPTDEADLHLTLAFLGATLRERVPALSVALEQVARRHAGAPVTYAGVGAFPDARAPRVLWAGIREERPGELARLAADVARTLEPLGFPPERRAFHAHVTLARVRTGLCVAATTRSWLTQRAQTEFGPDFLSDLKLIVSLVGRERYAYKDLTTHPLSGGA